MELGDRLREIRKSANQTLADVSRASTLSVSYLSDLERNKTRPSFETLEKIAGHFGLTVANLLQGVAGYGEADEGGLAPGLAELMQDDVWGVQLSEDWVRLLNRIELRGRRPQNKTEWLEVFLHLKRVLDTPGGSNA